MTSDTAMRTIHLLRAVTLQTNMLAADFARANALNTTDVRALIGLLDRERSGLQATPGWLAEHLAVNSASTTALVDRLVRRGLVTRSRDHVDRRRVVLVVTPAARDLGESFFEPVFNRISDAANAYSADEMDIVDRFLVDVASALR
ncbi:MarR family transcriptional regulator [Gordonia malaquae]|uniref:MarR family winged helix-turn-helix transcriptional regulator n=1 Tax=Gordonia malaquae TaxID=410332 RepID=UPI0030C78C58